MDGPELPEAGYRVWGWYRDLDAKRGWFIGMGAAAPAPIAWGEIQAYFQLIGQQPQPWQARLLADLDALYRATVSGEDVEQAGTAKGLGSALKGE